MHSTKVIKNLNPEEAKLQVQAMINHFVNYNFLRRNNNKYLTFDFNSERLKHIVKNEWLYTNSVFCDQPAFCFSSLEYSKSLKSAFSSVKNLVASLPFSLIEVHETDHKNIECEVNDDIGLIKNQFKHTNGTILKNHILCDPASGNEFFYKQQRERKIWWRKFSALPGRFHTTEICSNESQDVQFVEIKADFPWGKESVELIKYCPNALLFDAKFFEMTNRRKKILPHIITSEISLERAALTYLCDSYEKFNEDTDRDMLRFSKNLAPYKVAFAAHSNLRDTENLKELVILLAKKIKKLGVAVLFLPDTFHIDVDKQILRNDALGIPYTILLNTTTLKDGVIALRSRDTTLQEQSHVSLIVSYIEALMKSQ